MGPSASAAAAHPTLIDWLLAAVATAGAVVGTEIVVRAAGSDRPLDWVAYALLVVTAAPLAFRDRYPVAVLLAVGAATVAYTWLGYAGGFYTIGLVFAMWAAVAAGHRIVAVLVAVGIVGSVVGAAVIVRAGHAVGVEPPIWLVGWLLASIVLGEVSRGRRQYLDQVEQRAIEAERTREEEARRRAGEERMRIARELHDVLAHNISMINVQAGAALHLIDRQPEQARSALEAINDASREALRELRATLGVLRQVDEAEPRAPAPGLAQLDELVERARAAGLQVELIRGGDPVPLPRATDLAAYRIVQESLTNVTRHAGASTVAIVVEHGAGILRLTVEDNGRGLATGTAPIPGNGISGMRERAATAGGELEVGPRPEGGFRVRARLPLRSDR